MTLNHSKNLIYINERGEDSQNLPTAHYTGGEVGYMLCASMITNVSSAVVTCGIGWAKVQSGDFPVGRRGSGGHFFKKNP